MTEKSSKVKNNLLVVFLSVFCAASTFVALNALTKTNDAIVSFASLSDLQSMYPNPTAEDLKGTKFAIGNDIYEYVDGKWQSTGEKTGAIAIRYVEEPTNGVSGKDGIDGKDGVDGRDGIDGKDGIDGVNGLDGADGKDGLDGADGKDGLNGKDGADGRDGIDGKDGRDGKDGADGQNGRDGRDGVDGRDGLTTSVNGVEQVNGNISLTLDDIEDGTLRLLSPIATRTALGQILVGDGLSVGPDGTLSVNFGDGLTLSSDGTIKINIGEGLALNNGFLDVLPLSVNGIAPYNNEITLTLDDIGDGVNRTLSPIADEANLGQVMIGDGLSVDDTGLVSVNAGEGLQVNNDGSLGLSLGDGLEVDENGKITSTVSGGTIQYLGRCDFRNDNGDVAGASYGGVTLANSDCELVFIKIEKLYLTNSPDFPHANTLLLKKGETSTCNLEGSSGSTLHNTVTFSFSGSSVSVSCQRHTYDFVAKFEVYGIDLG